jgi:hypothetical protein
VIDKVELERRRTDAAAAVYRSVARKHPLIIVKAPPGSGKTYLTQRAVALAAHRGDRIAVATQTNAQADDFCARMARELPRFGVFRFASASSDETDLGRSISWIRASRELPVGPCIVVATSAKWASSEIGPPFDVAFVDEAWQSTWADFRLLGRLAPRFVLVGDPGQIPPVVSIDAARWETSRRAPHRAAPEVVLADPTVVAERVELPVTSRLPHDTCELVRSFYDFSFDSWSAPGERAIRMASRGGATLEDRALESLATGSMTAMTLPTPTDGGLSDDDPAVTGAVVRLVERALARGARVLADGTERQLRSVDIGICATHRVVNQRIRDGLGPLAANVRVDTAERWQGLERPLMIVVHPLSGTMDPSPFDLNTGRLCVMASRHRAGLVIVSRDHVGETLRAHLPVADQAPGCPDVAGRGHAQHLAFWEGLERRGAVLG